MYKAEPEKRKERTQKQFMIQEKIISIIEQAGKPISREALLEHFTDEERPSAMEQTGALLASGKLLLTRRNKLALPEQTGLINGTIQAHQRGFGFFLPKDRTIMNTDAFIPADAMHGAMHRDEVWVRLSEQTSRNGTPEGEVVLIVNRAYTQIVGTYEQGGKLGGCVVPDDTHVPFDMMIAREGVGKAKHGDKVVAKVLHYPDGRRPMFGSIVEVLGAKDAPGTDILSAMRQFRLPQEFSKAAMRQAKSIEQSVPEDAVITRERLYDKCIVTIDGADAKDLDDAISLERLQNGNYYLGVHIADVSAYVKEGSALDRDALERGTSVYLVDRVIPMLPKELSNGICSLNEGQERLTLSCFMEIDSAGKVVSYRLSETVIKSRYRLVYEDVTKLLEGDEEQQNRYADIVPMLKNLEELAAVLRQKRFKRGSIDFDLDEARVLLNEQGKAIGVEKEERGVANRIIEECMLIANETVAQHMSYLEVPFIYRVHETPDKEKLTDLNAFVQTLGYGIKHMKDIHPRTLQRLIEQAKGTNEENIVGKVTLRAMKKARYSELCLGHFGLAAKYYCHFTSPIRRYPDLIGHRIIKEVLNGSMTQKRAQKLLEKMPDIAKQCSETERIAMEAERAVEDMKKCEYMSGHIGESYAGVIAGVTSFGFFVALPNTVEGLVRAASLDDDYYEYDEKQYRLVGRRSGRVFRLGDAVRVRVSGVDIAARNIDFELDW